MLFSQLNNVYKLQGPKRSPQASLTARRSGLKTPEIALETRKDLNSDQEQSIPSLLQHQSEDRWSVVKSKLLLQTRWRQVAGAGLLGLCVATLAVINLRKRAAEAYITGDVITVKSPIQGRVDDEMLSTGELFKPGTALVSVVASRQDEARQQTAQLELEQTRKDIRSTELELDNLVSANQARLRNDLQGAERELFDLEGQEQRYAKQASRYRDLVSVGAVDPDTLAGVEANANSYRQRATNQRRVVSDLRQELQDANSKRKAGSRQLPRSTRRLEMLELEISRINNQLNLLRGKEKKLLELVNANQRRSQFVYTPSFNGLMLSNRIARGSEVNAGEALITVVDCDQLRVEAVFSSNKVKDVRIGDQVKLKMAHQNGDVSGRVISMRGVRGIRALENTDAAQFKATNDDRMRLQIALPADHQASKDCRLGDRVDVEL